MPQIPNIKKIEIEEEVKEIKEKVETVPLKEEEEDLKLPSRQEKKKESKVDDDFFELIDSMYKERIDG